MELRMTIAGELIDSIKLNASRVKADNYIKSLEEDLRHKHHGLIVRLEKPPCFCVFVPTENNF
jgi:hypothetical protein